MPHHGSHHRELVGSSSEPGSADEGQDRSITGDRLAFTEFIQDECNADNLVSEIRQLIEDNKSRSAMLAEYAAIRELLGGAGASHAVARAMIEELH